MKETITKPDGDIIFQSSPCCCPPDSKKPKGAIHTRAFTYWIKVNYTGSATVKGKPISKGESNWESAGDLGRFKQLKEDAERAESVLAFLV